VNKMFAYGDKNKYIVDPTTECWLWHGSLSKGYGRLKVPGRTSPMRAHIYFYEQKYGPVPEGMELDHFKCNTKRCVNPDHVRPETHHNNVSKSVIKYSEQEREHVKTLRNDGATYLEIVRATGIPIGTLHRLIHG